MCRMTLFAALAALVLSAPVAKAEGLTVGLQGGMAVPMGDFSDGFGPGPQGGVFGDFWLNPQFAVGADIVGNFHKAGGDFKDAIEAAGFSADDVKFSIVQFGFDVGAGVDFAMSEAMMLGVNAHLHTVPDAIESFDPTTANSTGSKSAQYFSRGVTLTFATSGGN